MTTKLEHLQALRRHDWSYMMSDYGFVYRRGAAEESALLSTEKNNPELKGMYETYRKWWWDIADGSNTIDSGIGRLKGAPEPTFDI
jgi:hypothetical protein